MPKPEYPREVTKEEQLAQAVARYEGKSTRSLSDRVLQIESEQQQLDAERQELLNVLALRHRERGYEPADWVEKPVV
jgi:hypothetical protein